jgi:hypothetical protein
MENAVHIRRGEGTMLKVLEGLAGRVPFWLPLTTLFLFLGFDCDGWIIKLVYACLSTVSISGLISAHLSEWKAGKFRMF